MIPREVTRIGKDSFSDCKRLRIIELSNESKLQTTEESAFIDSSIESITIPQEDTRIEKATFS